MSLVSTEKQKHELVFHSFSSSFFCFISPLTGFIIPLQCTQNCLSGGFISLQKGHCIKLSISGMAYLKNFSILSNFSVDFLMFFSWIQITYAFIFFLSQYGLLHLGHTLGVSFRFLGTHLCPHLSQRKPSTSNFTISGI
jgi:hypothetical protein